MSKLIKMLENEKEIGFCSCVIKTQSKSISRDTTKEQKVKIWLDYFNDIASNDVKSLIKNQKNLKVKKYLASEENKKLSKSIANKNLNLLFNNPFEFDLKKIIQKNQKSSNLKIKRNHSLCVSKKKKKISFDDLKWNDVLKKYINLKDTQQFYSNKDDIRNLVRNKSCIDSFNHKKNLESGICEIYAKQVLDNFPKHSKVKLKEYIEKKEIHNEKEIIKNGSCFLLRCNCDKSENSFIQKGKQKDEFNIDKDLIKFQLHEINGIEEKIKKEILTKSKKIKDEIMKQNNDKIMLIQDQKNGKAKIVANQKIEIGEVILIEEHFLETSILFNDLWETFNNLDDKQKKILDNISEFMNIGKVHKRNNSEHNLKKHKCEINSNYNCDINENNFKDNMKHGIYNSNYCKSNSTMYTEYDKTVMKKNETVYNEYDENITKENNFENEIYYETRKKKNRNVEFNNDNFINNLIKFEIFTDILKNSFISCDDRTKVVLFKNTSFLNHSCFPNALYCFIENNKICLLAVRTINMYDEVTISFISELYAPIEYRKSKIKDMKNINCSCNRCLQIIDEERNIICPTCKYSYVSKKMNEECIKIMEKNKEDYVKQQNIDKFLYINESDMENEKLSTFSFKINDKFNNSESLNKTYLNDTTMNKYIANDHNKIDEHVNQNICKDINWNYVLPVNLNSNNKSYEKFNAPNDYHEHLNGYKEINNNDENKKNKMILSSPESYTSITNQASEIGLNTYKGKKESRIICSNKHIKKNEEYDLISNKGNIDNIISDNVVKNYFLSQISDDINETDSCTNKNNHKICNCLYSIPSSNSNKNLKKCLGISVEKRSLNEKIEPEEYSTNIEIKENKNITTPLINESLLNNEILEKNINLDNNLVNILNMKSMKEYVGYCKFHNNGKWICDICNYTTPTYAMPLESEKYFIKEYKSIKEKINSNKFDMESIINNIEKSLLYIMAILGESHWLYASFNYIIADLCFSFYNFNSLNKKYLLKSFNSFQNFFHFIQIKCPQAIHTDLVPLVLKFLIICLYTCNYKKFYELILSGFLELIRQRFGSWDISYISLFYSFKICYEKFNNNFLINRKIILTLADLANVNMLKNHFY